MLLRICDVIVQGNVKKGLQGEGLLKEVITQVNTIQNNSKKCSLQTLAPILNTTDKNSLNGNITHTNTSKYLSLVEEKGGTSLSTKREKGIELYKSFGMKNELHNEGGTSSSNENIESRPIPSQFQTNC